MSAWAIPAAVALLLANGFFVWSEFALIAARRSRIERLADEGHRLARVARGAMSDLNFVLAGAQLGITMASLGLGYVAEPAVADLLAGPLEDLLPGALAHTLEVVLALAIVVSAHMVLGEMVPKNLAIAEPERSAVWVALPFRFYTAVFGPAIRFLNVLANRLLRLVGIEPRDELVEAHTADEIAAMLEQSRSEGVIEASQHGLLSRTLLFDRLDARGIMVPRPDVVAVPLDAAPAEVDRVAVETGYSRIPVYRESLDDIVGFVHVKDLLALPPDDGARSLPPNLVRRALVVPGSRLLPDLLSDMQRERRHFAVVVDEHGGVAGLVTLEDILEELVGEIRDEHDPTEGSVWRLGPRRLLVDAGLRPDELERSVGLEIPEGDYDTVAGFLLSELGRLPMIGDEVSWQGWLLRVQRMSGHRVDLVEVVRPRAESSGVGEAP